MTLGLAQAAWEEGYGVDVRLALDSDAAAVAVYKSNFSSTGVVQSSVERMFDGSLGAQPTVAERELRRRVGAVDALVGGPPCQGNSDLNNHTRREDPRNGLYLCMARAAEILRPKLVVIENVPAVRHERSGVVRRVRDALEALRYEVADAVIGMSALGVPQRRNRHLLVASTTTKVASEVLAAVRNGRVRDRSVGWAISDLLSRAGAAGNGFDSPSRSTSRNLRRIAWLFENHAFVLADDQRPDCHRLKRHSYKSVYGRMQWDKPAPTITTGFGSMGQGCYVHPKRRRTITPHEAARLQTFPDFFRFDVVEKRTAWARLIGNAVPPLLMLTVGRAWLRAENESRSR